VLFYRNDRKHHPRHLPEPETGGGNRQMARRAQAQRRTARAVVAGDDRLGNPEPAGRPAYRLHGHAGVRLEVGTGAQYPVQVGRHPL
ncbi:hypothetical protein, partial [Pseudomonas sp. FEN]